MRYSDVCAYVKTVTKKYGNENSWSLGSCLSTTGASTFSNNKQYTTECCQAPGSYELKCKCSYGDGWHGGYLEIDGTTYCENFDDGQAETHNVEMIGRLNFRNIWSSWKISR